jgi:hypothetical protein
MNRKAQWLVAAIVCLVSTPQIYGQMGFPPIKRPNIANIFHPVVGSGTAYEQTSSDGSKKTLEMSIVGMEMLGTQQGYWMEVGHVDRNSPEVKYAKVLLTPDDFAFHKIVFMMPGSTQPMEMDMDAAKSHRDTMDKKLEKWHTVGTESITVPAGTFSCEHWTKDEGKGDVWVSSKFSPMGIVKSVDGNETMVLTKVISDAKTHIVGTPMKFDPQMLRQQIPMNQQKP